ncbi:MAG: hypothetical protein OXF02_04125 [Simkaniaceae bacterium]|nr:hypothetical protein [Simkaniaceae bacterium]
MVVALLTVASACCQHDVRQLPSGWWCGPPRIVGIYRLLIPVARIIRHTARAIRDTDRRMARMDRRMHRIASMVRGSSRRRGIDRLCEELRQMIRRRDEVEQRIDRTFRILWRIVRATGWIAGTVPEAARINQRVVRMEQQVVRHSSEAYRQLIRIDRQLRRLCRISSAVGRRSSLDVLLTVLPVSMVVATLAGGWFLRNVPQHSSFPPEVGLG